MIYMLTHKVPEYGLQDDEYHTPIHCGSALSDKTVCSLRDDTGDNISEKNPWFLETTGIYWIWKNDNHQYKGQYQFRRRFDINPEMIPGILKEYDIIVPIPAYFVLSVYKHYERFHIQSDLNLCYDIICERYPEYKDRFDDIIRNKNVLYYSNGFITTKEKYDEMCSFVFDVLFEYEKRMGLKTKEEWVEHGKKKDRSLNSHKDEMSDAEYQSRVCGYLSERIFTLYIISNFDKRYHVRYHLMEKNMYC